jgi:arabinan endo-1,5-alpha-L-arabinosidase
MKNILLISWILNVLTLNAQTINSSISVHDPVIIKEDSTFYIFCTGNGISVFSSADMKNWKREKPVFNNAPAWAVAAVPGFKGHIWAPDISYQKGLYYLYYSVSAFGKNTSCIGVATNKSLNPQNPSFKWLDQGKVVQSYPGVTNWNAIDPNFITDKKGKPYLAFGSFWDGLKIVKLTKNRLHVDGDFINLQTIASRKKNPHSDNPLAVANKPVDAGANPIEAPFIFKKDTYYYLFASIDYCCKGENSTYKMITGRADNVKGPCLDKNGVDLAKGGGDILLQGDKNWHGVGHNAVATFDGVDYLVFHAYHANDRGRSKLRIEKLAWENGWPILTVTQ